MKIINAVAGGGGGGVSFANTSEIAVRGGNGTGSTDTKIRRFTTLEIEDGTDITYAESAANGSTFTVNTAGVYLMNFIDEHTSNNVGSAISLNSANLTSNASSIHTDLICFSTDYGGGGDASPFMGIAAKLSATDVIRGHIDSNGTLSTDNRITFRMVKVGNLANASEIAVRGGNGLGSTDTKIRRFTTLGTEDGTDITYAESAANGSTFTINTDGVYSMNWTDQMNTADNGGGISLNSASLTSNASAIHTELLCLQDDQQSASASSAICMGVTAKLSSTDVIRAHVDGGTNLNAGNWPSFRIVRIA